MKVGRQLYRTLFVVVLQLGADVILVAMYIDKFFDHYSTRRQHVLHTNYEVLNVIRRPGRLPIEKSYDKKFDVPKRGNSYNAVVWAKRFVLQSGTQTPVLVKTNVEESRVLDGKQNLYLKREVALANVLADFKSNCPFTVLVANFGKKKQVLSAHQIIGQSLSAQIVNAMEEFKPSEEPFGIEDVDLSYAPKEMHGRVRTILSRRKKMLDCHLGTLNVT